MKIHNITRRTFTSAAALAAASLAAPSLRAQGKLEKSKVARAVGGKAAFYYLPLTIAEQLATNVCAGTITSSPAPIPQARSDMCKAS